MPRRRHLFRFAPVLVAWVLLFVQGVCDTAHFAALSLLPPTAPLACALPSAVDEEARHAAVCHCKMCHGVKTCCCVNARNEREGVAFRAVCDTSEKTSLPSLVAPARALPPALLAVAAPLSIVAIGYPAVASASWHPYPPQPSTPPPSV